MVGGVDHRAGQRARRHQLAFEAVEDRGVEPVIDQPREQDRDDDDGRQEGTQQQRLDGPMPHGAARPAPSETPAPGRETARRRRRSEEHTSELQSLMRLSYAAFSLKKKNT